MNKYSFFTFVRAIKKWTDDISVGEAVDINPDQREF